MPDAPLPCSTCPWRLDQTAATIPNYRHDLACGLTSTVGKGDAFRPIMACHHSTDESMVPCNGYLAREGWSNIRVRLEVIGGRMPRPDDVADACASAGIRLHKTYRAVLAKLSRTKERSDA